MKIASIAFAAMVLAAPAAFAQTTPAPSASGMFYTHQSTEMRASKLIGTNVTNAANESVGEINEILLGKDGKVAAVIVGVGGFLGMGEREVAMSYSSLRIARDTNGKDVVTVNATKDQLKAAPAWKWETR